MKSYTENELLALVKARLSEKRYNHTLAVARLSGELAEHYCIFIKDATTAAILHDITKEDDVACQLQMLDKSDIIKSKSIYQSENVYHAITGYLYARDILCIENEDVLNAIRYHTTGRAGMSMLEKIIFTADTVAYDRTYAEAKSLRKLAFSDLNKCMLDITSFLISDLVKKMRVINIDTIECYNSLL